MPNPNLALKKNTFFSNTSIVRKFIYNSKKELYLIQKLKFMVFTK